jgi:large subunit ribosomal protein L1
MKVVERSKRYRACVDLIDRAKSYSLDEAVEALKKLPPPKFDQTVTLSFRLGVDPRQSDQMVRGTCPLPNGSGKLVRVLVFAQGQAAEAAREAGAEYVGFEDLIKKCQEGFQDFDVAIATPGAMSEAWQNSWSQRFDAKSQDGHSNRGYREGHSRSESRAG